MPGPSWVIMHAMMVHHGALEPFQWNVQYSNAWGGWMQLFEFELEAVSATTYQGHCTQTGQQALPKAVEFVQQSVRGEWLLVGRRNHVPPPDPTFEGFTHDSAHHCTHLTQSHT